MQTYGEDTFKANIEYVRRLYENVLDWYKSADYKAQIIVALNGAFVTFVTTSLFQESSLFVKRLPWHTMGLLVSVVISLAISLYHAVSCLRSRIYLTDELAEFLSKEGVNRTDYQTYKPSVCWFFQMVSALDKSQFEKRMRNLETGFEVDAMTSAIYELSANVSKKHLHVNFGFAFAALTFLLFVASWLSYLYYLQTMPS
jgi:hypothetical protein